MIPCFRKSVLATLAVGLSFAALAQTSVNSVPNGWHLQDLQENGYYGISLDKAYNFVKGKKSTPIIVAVIDSGVDTTHEDLKSVLWTNPKEIPGNGIDDDHNGYIDDVHGWNFLGGKDGRNVTEDSYEAARVYHKFKSQFENVTDPSTLSKEDQYKYNMWKKAEAQVVGNQKSGIDVMVLKRMEEAMVKGDSVLRKEMGKETYTGKDLEAFTPVSDNAKRTKMLFLSVMKENNIMDMTNSDLLNDLREELASEEKKVEAITQAPEDYRGEVVKDNYNDINDRDYGNNNIMVSKDAAMHGTHVSGIIGADRTNGKGIMGIADNVKIMMVRAVPDGDEHDKDIANAIRYAVDNGARVINMSFGKSFSPEKSWVDDAVKYAASKNVLLVHAAGNDAADVDTTDNFPTPHYLNSDNEAPNWITVGASGDPKAGGIVAYFSNYGKKEVDVFAPGVKIYSSVPGGNTYANLQGTSMASPVVAGVAALVLEYYPNLTAEQVKYVIEKSAEPVPVKVLDPGTHDSVSLSDISKTGGIVNAYDALRLADAISNGKQEIDDTKEKMKEDKIKVKTHNKKMKAKTF